MGKAKVANSRYYRIEIDRLREELSECRQALGLMTTAKPSMEMDVAKPVAMAAEVVAEIERLRSDNENLKTVLRRDEEQLSQWEERAREAHNDMMRVVQERDNLKAEIERVRAELHRWCTARCECITSQVQAMEVNDENDALQR